MISQKRYREQPGFVQQLYDFVGAPLRMVLLPDEWSRKLGFTSLQDERFRAVLPEITGRLLDIGAGDNQLVETYGDGVGVDVVDWSSSALVVSDTRELPFEDQSFDTVTFIACLNHIPYREDALREAHRLLRPGGRLIVTMIGSLIGEVGHKLWWYSEDKHRDVAEGEVMGMDPEDVKQLIRSAGFVLTKHEDVKQLIRSAGFVLTKHRRFVYQLNHLFVAVKES